MAKYSYELKKKVVETYLNGEGGSGYIETKMDRAAKKLLKNKKKR